jgi:hypothetical protein
VAIVPSAWLILYLELCVAYHMFQTGKAAPRKTPGEIRIQKDIAELDGGTVAVITFPNPNNLCNFQVS